MSKHKDGVINVTGLVTGTISRLLIGSVLLKRDEFKSLLKQSISDIECEIKRLEELKMDINSEVERFDNDEQIDPDDVEQAFDDTDFKDDFKGDDFENTLHQDEFDEDEDDNFIPPEYHIRNLRGGEFDVIFGGRGYGDDDIRPMNDYVDAFIEDLGEHVVVLSRTERSRGNDYYSIKLVYFDPMYNEMTYGRFKRKVNALSDELGLELEVRVVDEFLMVDDLRHENTLGQVSTKYVGVLDTNIRAFKYVDDENRARLARYLTDLANTPISKR